MSQRVAAHHANNKEGKVIEIMSNNFMRTTFLSEYVDCLNCHQPGEWNLRDLIVIQNQSS